jgi:hypothetical protein
MLLFFVYKQEIDYVEDVIMITAYHGHYIETHSLLDSMTRLKLCCHAFLFDVSSIIRMFVKLMNMNMCFEQFDYFSYRQIW